MFTYIFVPILLSFVVAANVIPTFPGPGDSFNAGGDCLIKWNADTSSVLSNVTILLMAGSNSVMQVVTTVVSGIDGRDSGVSSYTWKCPEVNPYSEIYFYQFTNTDDQASSEWTTRFTIASPSGETTLPMHRLQPDGASIPWGPASLSTSQYKTGSTSTTTDSTNEMDPHDISPPMDISRPASTRMRKAIRTGSHTPSSNEISPTPVINLPQGQPQASPTGLAYNPPSAMCPGIQATNNAARFDHNNFAYIVSILFLVILTVSY